ncbi:MAG TPA: hypothetical protein VGH34_00140 [Vicinamibacterales bacterium]
MNLGSWTTSTIALTRHRIWMAYGIAASVDACQWLLGPIGWVLPDEVLDVVAAILISWTIGFHPLLLPTFVLELLPVADLLPTWTGCVALVILLRRKTDPPPPGPGAVIDV